MSPQAPQSIAKKPGHRVGKDQEQVGGKGEEGEKGVQELLL
jgi:hypothetical protein